MYTVRWKKTALSDLTSFWIQADSALRKAITQASHQIDKTLARDPENTGESRIHTDKVWFVFPLGIRFEVDAHNKTARILQVWLYKKRK
jgi:hypothetical protein